MTGGEAASFRVERETADGGGTGEAVALGIVSKHNRLFPHARGDHAGFGAGDNVINPFVFEVGEGFALALKRNDIELAIIAAGEKAFAIRMQRGAKHDAVVDGHGRASPSRLAASTTPSPSANSASSPIQCTLVAAAPSARRRPVS